MFFTLQKNPGHLGRARDSVGANLWLSSVDERSHHVMLESNLISVQV
jgi:hypothetical protein